MKQLRNTHLPKNDMLVLIKHPILTKKLSKETMKRSCLRNTLIEKHITSKEIMLSVY